MKFSTKKIAAATFAIGAITYQPALIAATYEALCAGQNCTITTSPESVIVDGYVIKTDRIARWATGEEETYDSAAALGASTAGGAGGALVGAAALCWTVFLCPAGIGLGYLSGSMGTLGAGAGQGNKWTFTIDAYDDSGEKIYRQFRFINKKPVNRLKPDLQAITGLPDGSTVSNKRIEELEKPIAVAKEEEKRNSSNCWSHYLEDNPPMKAWAEANPTMAEKTKQKYDDC